MKEEKHRILIIEDDLNNINILIKAFGDQYKLYVADNGAEGIQLAKHHHPDLILLDVIMPGMDGFEVCRQLKDLREFAAVPILFMTALSESENIERAFESGGTDYIAKPFRFKEIQARVEANLKIQNSLRQECMKEREAEIQGILAEIKQKQGEVDRLKTAFLANLSHEIRTPLSAITGFCELLTEREFNTDTRKEYLGIIKDNADHLLQMVSDILDISMLESNQLVLLQEKVEVNNCLKNIYASCSDRLKGCRNSGIEFRLKLPSDIGELYVETDKKRLCQLLSNLIDNAIKFTPKGLVEFGYQRKGNNQLQFFVYDSGIGISRQKQEVIFDAFRQVEDHYTREYGGTGMGLTIVKKVLELMGGSIQLDSEKEKGTRIELLIPFASMEAMETELTTGEEFSVFSHQQRGQI